MTRKGAKKNQQRGPREADGPPTPAPSERRKKGAAKKATPAALPKEPKGAGGKKGGGLH